MTELYTPEESETESEAFPVEPRYHPIHKIPRLIYDFLASAKLAMFLLVAILGCCLTGTTIYREKQAWDLIFSTLWFNSLLVLLVVNVACCFFGRIWHRKLTLISFGMILFHLSFVTMFVGIIYNSLFYFRGTIRMTEGETLPSYDPQSYDTIDRGRYFNFSKLKGDTSLIKMHTGYNVDGKNKRAAYEISVGAEPLRQKSIIYITHYLDHRGFKYFPDKEGYSVLAVMYDKQGREIYGGYLPLQSLSNQVDRSYVYTIGTKESAGVINFPQDPMTPLLGFNITFRPDKKAEKTGEINFDVYPVVTPGVKQIGKPITTGKVVVGAMFDAGSYLLSVKEVRYWAAMAVRYEPGQPIILASLWVGLFGVALTTLARMFKKRTVTAKRAVIAASPQS